MALQLFTIERYRMKDQFGVYIVIGIISSLLSYAIYYMQFKKYEKDIESHNEFLTEALRKARNDYQDAQDKYLTLLAYKQESFIEGIDGVKFVSLSALKYVELLTKEKELLELKTKLKDM